MPRATISDVAARAGVSTATVDRALNGRRGVSAANRQRVMKAARDLGYLPEDGSIILPARPARLEFLIPRSESDFLSEVTESILRFAVGHPLVQSCRIIGLDDIGPDGFAEGLDRVSNRTNGIGIVTTDHPSTRTMLRRASEAGLKIVTVASDIPATPRSTYIGVDDHAAGRTAAQIMGMLAGGRTGTVAVFYGSRSFIGHLERDRGFRDCLAADRPALNILPSIETGEQPQHLRDTMGRLLRARDDLIGVYCVGAGRRGIVEALTESLDRPRPSVIVHDLTTSSRRWLQNDQIDAVIDQNARLIGEQSVLRLLEAIASNSAPRTVHTIEPRIILRENLPAETLP